MIEHIETLDALEKYETMSKASTALRISQSAVSKRIAGLEFQIGKKLIERQGRRVVLTSDAISLLIKVRPLLVELKQSLHSESVGSNQKLSLGVSESILSSWGAKLLGKLKNKYSEIELTPHAHRSPVVIDRVRSGEYMIGICAGFCAKAPDLFVEEIGQEEFVIIRSSKNTNELMTIEESSETWQSISRQVKKEKLNPTLRLESFFAIAALANSGVVDGLVPIGVAKSLGINKAKLVSTNITRPIIMVGRKTTLSRKSIANYYSTLKTEMINYLNKHS